MAVSDHDTAQVGQRRAAGDIARRSADQRPRRTGAGIVPAVARGGCERALYLRVEWQVWFRLLPVPDPSCSSALSPCCEMRGAVHAIVVDGHGCRDGRTTSSDEPSMQDVVLS